MAWNTACSTSLGKIALERELRMVVVTFIATKKNEPAAHFLENVVAQFRQETRWN